MINALQSELGINVIASIIVSALFLGIGFVWGKYKERRRKFGRNLEEYDFYPFTVTRENFGEFSLKDFRLGMTFPAFKIIVGEDAQIIPVRSEVVVNDVEDYAEA